VGAFKRPHGLFALFGGQAENSESLLGQSLVILQDGLPDWPSSSFRLVGLESRLQESLGFPAIASAVTCQRPVYII
jgi:hypothetical protein